MASDTYDIITVGGGLGGSALAKAMAEHGARVLVLERERQFKDRVRGEQMHPWGVVEARELGIYDVLRDTCGHELPWLDIYLGPEQIAHRNITATTSQQLPELAFYHPMMQEVLLSAAANAGAEVHRGATVREVRPGAVPAVVVEQDGQSEEVQARLVVGADGRASLVRKWAGFAVRQDPPLLQMAGVLLDEMSIPPDTSYANLNPSLGQAVFLFPQGNGRVRAYFTYQQAATYRLQGTADLARFIAESVQTGAPPEFYAGVRASGPLATFDAADTWVAHPYRAGVVLIGDAAASNDPSFGEGLSLTVRDVRVLRDQLLANTDWDVAGHAYAEAHDRHYGVIHTVTNWWEALFYETGLEAQARRARVLPLLAQDGTRMPDHLVSGPDLPLDETIRRRFFGEE